MGFKNYKFFVLFLVYATVSCFLYQVAGISLVIAVFVHGRVDASLTALLCAVITGAFAFALTFFTLFHISLVLSGQTTIEVHAQRTHHRLDSAAPNGTAQHAGSPSSPLSSSSSSTSSGGAVGWRDNWRAVFGDSWRTWLLPVDSCVMTGYEFDFEEEEVGEDVERGLISTNTDRRGGEEEGSVTPHSAVEDREDSVNSTSSGSSGVLSSTPRHQLVPTEDSEERV